MPSAAETVSLPAASIFSPEKIATPDPVGAVAVLEPPSNVPPCRVRVTVEPSPVTTL